MEIDFQNVSYNLYKNTPLEKKVLSNISFNLEKGKIYGFLGNSNSGKTSIGELINALIVPTRGIIKVGGFINDGKKIKSINKLRSMVGYVYQNPNEMFITKTVKTEIQFGMKYFNYKLKSIEKRTKESLLLVGLNEKYLNRKIESLSLSEQKKLEIACVIAFNPKIIIFDEPTVGLNQRDKNNLIRLMRIMKNKYNRTLLILTKDTDFLYKIIDYVYVLDKGSIVFEGEKIILTEEKLLDKYNLYFPKFLNFTNIAKKEKQANLEYYEEVKDLIKEVYRDVS